MSRPTRTIGIQIETVPIPSSLPVLQRDPEHALPYPLLRRSLDSWSGFRDRRSIPDAAGESLHTEWLAGLASECRTRQERERLLTRAALAVLDDEIAHATERIVHAGVQIDSLREQLTTDGLALSDSPTTSAEIYGTPAELMARRTREKNAHRVRIESRIHALETEVAECHERIVVAQAARRSHWAQLIVRVTHLDAHHRRRAHRYLRAATRRNTPAAKYAELTLAMPSWAHPDSIPNSAAA